MSPAPRVDSGGMGASEPPAASLDKVRTAVALHDEWRARTLNLIASENVLSPAARAILDSDLLHRYAEGHPHPGGRPARRAGIAGAGR